MSKACGFRTTEEDTVRWLERVFCGHVPIAVIGLRRGAISVSVGDFI